MNLSLSNNNALINFSPSQAFHHHLCWGIGEFDHCLGGEFEPEIPSLASLDDPYATCTLYTFLKVKCIKKKIKACLKKWGGCCWGVLKF